MFAVAPAAQANPHWYKSGSLIKEGKTIPTVTYGGELEQVSPIGKIHCTGVGGGTIENKVAGGVGKTLASEFYNCKAPECELQVKEASKGALSGKGEVRTEGLPLPEVDKHAGPGYENELTGTAEAAKEKIGLPWSAFPSPNQKEGETPPGMIRATVLCVEEPIKVPAIEAIFEGELAPEIGGSLNGLSSAHPSSAKFSGAATGGLHSELAGEGVNIGSIHYLEYTESAVLSVGA
jgi:hypothetical protein